MAWWRGRDVRTILGYTWVYRNARTADDATMGATPRVSKCAPMMGHASFWIVGPGPASWVYISCALRNAPYACIS